MNRSKYFRVVCYFENGEEVVSPEIFNLKGKAKGYVNSLFHYNSITKIIFRKVPYLWEVNPETDKPYDLWDGVFPKTYSIATKKLEVFNKGTKSVNW